MTAGFPGLPLAPMHQVADIFGAWPTLVRVVNNLLIGKTNNVISVTLTINVATTTVAGAGYPIGPNSFIGFMPTTANASAEIGAGTLYVSARGKNTMTITHANNANADRTFAVVIIG